MGKCQSHSGEQNLGFQSNIINLTNSTNTKPKPSSVSQPEKIPYLSTSILNKLDKDFPSSQFATPIKSQQIPPLTLKVKQRMKQLGEFDFSLQKYEPGKQLQPYQLKNHAIYIGEWKKGKPHGKGKYYLPDNSYFEGISRNGEIQGVGRIIHENGDYFEGMLKEGKAEGEGTYIQNDITYNGQFKNNLQHGKGLQFSQNYEFKGQFFEGFKQLGKLILKNKGIYEYEGEFDHNKFQGKGVLINDIGRYQGQFNEGTKDGYGKFTWNDGSYYLGEYENDEKQGRGKLYDKHNKIIKQGRWQKNHFVD